MQDAASKIKEIIFLVEGLFALYRGLGCLGYGLTSDGSAWFGEDCAT